MLTRGSAERSASSYSMGRLRRQNLIKVFNPWQHETKLSTVPDRIEGIAFTPNIKETKHAYRFRPRGQQSRQRRLSGKRDGPQRVPARDRWDQPLGQSPDAPIYSPYWGKHGANFARNMFVLPNPDDTFETFGGVDVDGAEGAAIGRVAGLIASSQGLPLAQVSEVRCVRLHPAVLQPDASALDAWVHQSDTV